MKLLSANVSIVPVNGKIPFFRWNEFTQRRATPDELRGWIRNHHTTGFAVICGAVSGGLEILDFDLKATLYPTWAARAGAIVERLPLSLTGGGGKQVAIRSGSPGRNKKLAYIPNPEPQEGEPEFLCAIETRGEGGYAVVPPSLHPSGNTYAYGSGHFAEAPFLSLSERDDLLRMGEGLDKRPPVEPRALTKAERTFRRYEDSVVPVVIRTFNERYSIQDMLVSQGYSQADDRGRRYIRPGGSNPSVVIGDYLGGKNAGKSYHHSANDPINLFREAEGYWHDPYDIYVLLEHNGDKREAWRAAADLLNIPLQRMMPPVPPPPRPPTTPQPYPLPRPPIGQPRPPADFPEGLVVITDNLEAAALITTHYGATTLSGPARGSWPGALARQVATYAHRVILVEEGHEGPMSSLAHQLEATLCRLPCPLHDFLERGDAAEFLALLRAAEFPEGYRAL